MLTKKEIEQLIDQQNSCLKIVKPKVTPKSSPIWKSFSLIYVNNIKQEYVICNECKDLLIYRPSSGTNSLSKHIRYCQNAERTDSNTQTNINQLYTSSKNEPAVPNHVKQEIKIACAEFTALDCQPFQVTRGIGFKNLVQKIFNAGRYFPLSKTINVEKLLPSPITTSRYIDQIYDQKYQQLVSICEKMVGYTIVVDFWTDAYTGIHYCGISLHRVDKNWKLNCFVLGCYPYDLESYSVINTRKFVESKLADYKLELNDSVYVVSDNEAKMHATFKLNCKRVGCSVHYINKQLEHAFTTKEIDKTPVVCDTIQEVFDSVKKIVAHVKRSHKQTEMSKRVQTYSETRFNGAYHMLHVFYEIFIELLVILHNTLLNECMLLDKDLLKQICSCLKVFDEVIEQLSDDKKPTIYKVLPLRQRLLNECDVEPNDHDGLKEMKVFLTKRLKQVWILNDIHYMSTLLHPSLKQFQTAPHEKCKAIQLVKDEILKRQSSQSSELSPSVINVASHSSTKSKSPSAQVRATTTNILFECFDIPVEDIDPIPDSSPDKEFTDYMNLHDTVEPDGDVLLFWKNHEHLFPTLASIVATIYSIPASNTTVERLFSTAGNTLSDRRTNLDPDKINKLLFLNKNLLVLKELDRDQLIHMKEKRKLTQMLMPSSTSSISNNIDNADEQELFSSSSTTAKKNGIRYDSDDQVSDIEIIHEYNNSINEDNEQE